MGTSDNFIFGEKAEWVQINDSMRRQILGFDEQMMLVKIEFKTGGIGYAHTHIHRQCTYVVSGIFEFQVGEITKIVNSGDGLYMEPNVIHGVKCIEGGVLIDTFSPIREDFLI
ncbi:MAG: cupin domain-containing protein [Paludibacter sp.]|nr:cupin domain-containing protein [Paludibacter sp.]